MTTLFPARAHRLGRVPGLAHPRLRPLTGDEVVALAGILAGMDPWRRLGSSEIALALYLDRPDPALRRYAVEADGVLAGVIALRWPWLRGPFIEMLAMPPPMGGRGLGRATVAWAAARAARAGGNLWASTSDFNAPARAFWRRMGFDEIAPLPGLVRPGATEILLRRQSSPALDHPSQKD